AETAARAEREKAEREAAKKAAGTERARAPEEEPSLVDQVVGSGMFKSLARSIGTQLGREISRSIFGTARRRR
ncbi:helicase HerA-like domain-containing protein, partial [Streptomyces hydrogenans]